MSWRSCRFIAWINPNRSLHRTMVRKFVLSASTFVSQNLTHPSWIATNGSARPGHPIIRIGDKHSKFFTSENAAINQVVTIWRDVGESVFGVVIILPLEIWQKRSLACVERVCMVLCVRGGYKSEGKYPTYVFIELSIYQSSKPPQHNNVSLGGRSPFFLAGR